MNHADLIAKGYELQPDGSWSKHKCGFVRTVETGVAKQTAVRPLDKGIQKRQTRKGSVEIIVTLITIRSRETDDDGNVAAIKPARDAIAESLGLDDGDKRIRWQYGQCESIGEPGVIVKIEMPVKQMC